MSAERLDEDAPEPTSLPVKAAQILAAVIVVPLIATLLLAWTLLGRLCSLRPCSAFILLVALVLIPIVVDWTLELDSYAFDSSMLDPVCVLVVMYAACVLALRHQSTISGSEAAKRRLASLPLALGVVVFLAIKIVAVSGADDEERWKVAWLWFAVLFSVFVYVSMAGWWTDASTPRLEVAEAALLKQYGQVEFEQSVVSGLGTVCVKGSGDPEEGFSMAQGGSGRPVLVLVHGYAAGNAFWMFVLKDLAAHFRVVCVELYGCGRSDRLPFNAKGPAATERLVVESLEKWRAEMGIEEMVLCGHSLGGMIASAYAMAHPHRLQKLMLLSPAGVGGVPDSGEGGDNSFAYKLYAFLWIRGVGPMGVLRWAGPLGSRVAERLVTKRLNFVPESAKIRDVDTKLLGDYVYQLLALPASGEKIIFPLLTPMLHAYTPVVETLKGGIARGGGGELGEGEARGINCPVSIIYGSPDHDWMPHRHGVALAERLTQQGIRANVYTVPEAGHTLIIDNPVDFTRIFLDACFEAGVAGPAVAARATPPTPIPPVGDSLA